MTATDLLDTATRCLVACAGPDGPLALPAAHWYDGEELWLTSATDSLLARTLARDPACTVSVSDAEVVLVAAGEARVFGAAQLARLAVHAGPVAGALAALAARHAGTLLGHTRDVVLAPARWLPQHRVVIRLRLREPSLRPRPEPAAGLAPALPAVVPPDVRRTLAGERRVLVVHGQGPPAVRPAVWEAGFELTSAPGRPLVVDGPVAVAAEPAGQPRSDEVRGLVLHGRLEAGRLAPYRATWWRGFDVAGDAVPQAPARGVVLPD